VDSSGNLFIVDQANHRIRRVDAVSGIITTVAGGGPSLGDGGPATDGQLNAPMGVAVDAAGNIYIADSGNNRIRKVDAATGFISTVAGDGTGTFSGEGVLAVNAQVNFPKGVAVDNSGNLVIADSGNNRVRRVDSGTGIITTIAGNGSFFNAFDGDGGPAVNAVIQDPSSLAFDSVGNMFIADYFGSNVRKVDAITGIITVVAGDGTKGYNGDGILAVNATLNEPLGVGLDQIGNLYIADEQNQRIRLVEGVAVAGPPPAPPAVPISRWSGNDDAADSVDGNDGILRGGTGFAAGVAGKAFQLDGIDDDVSVASAANLASGENDFSVEGWIKTTGTSGVAVEKKNSDGGMGYRLEILPGGQFQCVLNGVSAPWADGPVNDGQFHHVACVRSGDSWQVYLDGTLERQNIIPVGNGGISQGPLYIGSVGTALFWDGAIDEVTVHGGALTGPEVQSIFDAGAAAPVPCSPGTYNPDTGAEPCLQAPAGTFVDTTGAVAATDCAPGTYNPVTGAISCLPAPPGTFVDAAGAFAATDCALGTYNPNAGAISCLLAPVGTYVDTTGAIAATDCPAGTSTQSAGSTSVVDCVPPDSDGDGVNDEADLCPGTTAGATVDANGCDASGAFARLIAEINGLVGPRGIRNALLVKLDGVQTAIDNGQDKVALNKLKAFVNHVKAQKGKKLTSEQARLFQELADVISQHIQAGP